MLWNFTLITRTKTISTPIVIEKQINAYFKEVNLKIFIHEIIIQVARTSFNIQFLPENHQPQHTPIATHKLTRSSTLTEIFLTSNTFILKNSNLFNKYKDSLQQNQTEAIPNIQDNT